MEHNSKNLITGAVIVVLLAIGGFALYSMSGDDSSDTSTNSSTSQMTDSTPTTTPSTTTDAAPQSTIVELAVGTQDLSTLVSAVKAAELVDTLSGTGPFTVFAPTNAAFEGLPAGTLDTLLMPDNKTKLQAVLTYHVVSGKVLSSDLSDGQVVKTVQGNNLTVMMSGGKVMLKDATGATAEVVTADIAASNGVVHVINKVVLPE